MNSIPLEIRTMLDKLKQNGFQAYLVGGAVRDLLMKRPVRDFDLVTSAPPEEVMRIFPRHWPLGLKHGTVTVAVGDCRAEITTFRDSGLAGDLALRDFTINAIAMDDSGALFDFCKGQADLDRRLIRSPGLPEERLQEDGLRMLRAVRLAAELDFGIDPHLASAIQKLAPRIQDCSPERIREELNLMLLLPAPSRALRLLRHLGLLEHVLPELDQCYGFEQHSRHHHLNVFDHTMLALDSSPPRLDTRLGALFHDIGKPACFTMDDDGAGHFYDHHLVGIEITEAAMKRLHYSKRTIEKVKLLVQHHMSRFEALGERGARRLIRQVGEDNLQDLYDLQAADIKASFRCGDFSHLHQLQAAVDRVLKEGSALELKDLAITGRDLLALGWKEGPALGQILGELLEMVIENPGLNQRETLLAEAERLRNRC